MNVYEVIRAEHNEITDIMEQLMRGGDGNRLPWLDKLQKLLDHHLRAEDELLVARMGDDKGSPEEATRQAESGKGDGVSSRELRQLLMALVEDATADDFKEKV